MIYLTEMVEAYKDILKRFCVYNAEVARMAEEIEKGKEIDAGKLVYAGLQLADYKEHLLKCKEIIGFTDGLLFMEDDNYFDDFSIENGKLIGNKSSVYEGTRRWELCNMNEPDFCNYKYEVAIFARTLADPDYMSEEQMYKDLIKIRAEKVS